MTVHLPSRSTGLTEEQKLMNMISGNSFLRNNTFYQNLSYNGTAHDI